MKRKLKVVVLYVCVWVCVCVLLSYVNKQWLNASGHLLFLELQIGELFLFSIEKNGFQNNSIFARQRTSTIHVNRKSGGSATASGLIYGQLSTQKAKKSHWKTDRHYPIRDTIEERYNKPLPFFHDQWNHKKKAFNN